MSVSSKVQQFRHSLHAARRRLSDNSADDAFVSPETTVHQAAANQAITASPHAIDDLDRPNANATEKSSSNKENEPPPAPTASVANAAKPTRPQQTSVPTSQKRKSTS